MLCIVTKQPLLTTTRHELICVSTLLFALSLLYKYSYVYNYKNLNVYADSAVVLVLLFALVLR